MSTLGRVEKSARAQEISIALEGRRVGVCGYDAAESQRISRLLSGVVAFAIPFDERVLGETAPVCDAVLVKLAGVSLEGLRSAAESPAPVLVTGRSQDLLDGVGGAYRWPSDFMNEPWPDAELLVRLFRLSDTAPILSCGPPGDPGWSLCARCRRRSGPGGFSGTCAPQRRDCLPNGSGRRRCLAAGARAWAGPTSSSISACRRWAASTCSATLQLDPMVQRVPVIVLTGSDDLADIARGAELRANDYLTKPASPTLVLNRVKRLLTQNTRGRRWARAWPGSAAFGRCGRRWVLTGGEGPAAAEAHRMIRELLTAMGITVAHDAAAQAAGRDCPKTIVVVDDDSDCPSRMRLALAGEAYRLETAQAAETANLSSSRPDLIFLDPQVRAPDGTRLACRLLANRQLLRVPMIALNKEITPSREAFDGQIEEPIDAGELKDMVHQFLGPAARNRASHLPGLLLPHATEASRRKRVVGVLKAIEAGLPDSQFAPAVRAGLEGLADALDGIPECGLADYLPQLQQLWGATTVRARGRFRSLIRLCREVADREPDVSPALAGLRANYVEHRFTELVGLEYALLNRDYTALRKAAHNLKGMGAAYGFAELTDIGRALSPALKKTPTTPRSRFYWTGSRRISVWLIHTGARRRLCRKNLICPFC